MGSRNDVFSHSIALGWGNVATADTYGAGSYYYYPHAIMLGYNNYAKDDISAKHSLSAKTGDPETNSLLVGTSNTAYHYNSYLFGSRNISLAPTTDIDNDDGFVLAFGLDNIVGRNYDMVFGLSGTASGGENIVIGTPGMVEEWDSNQGKYVKRISRPLRASGYKNIAINSNIPMGANNLAIDSDMYSLTGANNSTNIFYNIKNTTLYSPWTERPIEEAGFDSITDNKLSNVDSSVVTAYMFSRNAISDSTNMNIYASFVSRNKFDNINQSTWVSNGMSNNVFETIDSISLSSSEIHKNIFFNVSSPFYVTAGEINNNIVWNTGNGHYLPTVAQLYQMQNNILLQSCILNSVEMEKDKSVVDRNFIMNSVISLSGSTYPGYDRTLGVTVGHTDWNNEVTIPYITNSFILGTVTKGAISETFSFGSIEGTQASGMTGMAGSVNGFYPKMIDRFGWSFPMIQHATKVFNYGDNYIVNATETVVQGYENELYGTSKNRVFGSKNGIISNLIAPTYSGWQSDGNNIIETTIIGQINFVGQCSGNYQQGKSTVIGENNVLINTGMRANYNTPNVCNNLVMGSRNASLDISDSLINSITGNSLYNWLIDENGFSRRINILPPTITSFNDSIELAAIYSAYAVTGDNTRNTIVGHSSVIGSDINDSTLIGNGNAIAAMSFTRKTEKMLYYSAHAEQWQSGKQEYDHNYCLYNDKLYYASYLWDYTAAPGTSRSSWTEITSPENINGIYSLSNNFAAGSYNLLLRGSNQIVLGSVNTASGYNATAVGEGLIAQTSQMVVGRFNEVLDGTNGLSADNIDSTTGALFIVGNGRHLYGDYATSGVERSNAMIVSADGTVSARRFVEAEPALTITGGNGITVTEDTANNKLVIDLESSLGQMVTELSAVLTNKPATGRHLLGVDNGSLAWLEVNQ